MRIHNDPAVQRTNPERNKIPGSSFLLILIAASIVRPQVPDSSQSTFQRFFGGPTSKDAELRSRIVPPDTAGRPTGDSTRAKLQPPTNIKYSYSDSLYPKESLNFRVDLSRKKLVKERSHEEQVKGLDLLDDRDTRVLRRAVRSEGVTFFHYTKFDTTVTSLLVLNSLEKLYRLGYVSKRKISPEQLFNFFGIAIEEKELNRKNELYLYEPVVTEKFVVEALQSKLKGSRLSSAEEEKTRRKLNLFLLNQIR